ncbi:hypothetical protein [Leptolyngbya sp. ST-U4]|uniref:hypothetical protein n=1 Tax=Leptolyngbya sp. ST-U4 TaxID=2933912 RepID=UPI0032978EFD
MQQQPSEENRLILRMLQPPPPLDHSAAQTAHRKIQRYRRDQERKKKAPRYNA